MGIILRYITIVTLNICVLQGFAQTDPTLEYQEAKRLFDQGEFLTAKNAFSSLTSDPSYGDYSIFFSGLCDYYLGNGEDARNDWRQLENKSWRKRSDVIFWLALSNYEDGNLREGIRYGKRLSDLTNNAEIENDLANNYLSYLPVDSLIQLNREFEDHSAIGKLLAMALYKEPVSYERNQLLEVITRQFNLDRSFVSDTTIENVYREAYAVAVFLPFMFESMENPWQTVNNKIVMQLYQGMLLARQHLDSNGIKVNLYPFDTRRNAVDTRELFTNDSLKEMDLIIGPLFPGPAQVVSEFSKENGINMINPLSSNPEVIGDNNYSFLMRPSYETMARALARRVIETVEHPVAAIYFEKTNRDSLFASIYREEVDTAGFEIVDFRSLEVLDAKALLDTLIEQYEEFLTQGEADSLMEVPGRFIKSRNLKPEELEWIRIETEDITEEERPRFDSLLMEVLPISITEEEEDTIINYEMKFKVEKDSIGHIMIASRNNVFVNNIISAIATREDTTRLFGYGNWFDFSVVSYDQLERLQVEVAYPDYIDQDQPLYDSIKTSMMLQYLDYPSDFHYAGYQIVELAGTLLNQYGKYFQQGFIDQEIIPSSLYQGFIYGNANDNQLVPIVTLSDRRLKSVNKPYIRAEED